MLQDALKYTTFVSSMFKVQTGSYAIGKTKNNFREAIYGIENIGYIIRTKYNVVRLALKTI